MCVVVSLLYLVHWSIKQEKLLLPLSAHHLSLYIRRPLDVHYVSELDDGPRLFGDA